MPIEYESGDGASDFEAPVVSFADQGHGCVGVVYKADTRHQEGYVDHDKSWLPKWWVKGENRPVLNAKQPEGGRPVMEYVFHVAVEQGKASFVKRDDEGKPIKTSSDKNAREVLTITEQDVAFTASSKWLIDLVKESKLNEGHKFRLKRTSPGKDENGDRMTSVDATLEILETVDNPKPYKPVEAPKGISYDEDEDEDEDEEPF